MNERQGRQLSTVGPDILTKIHEFEHLNNLEKVADVDLAIRKESMSMIRRTRRTNALGINNRHRYVKTETSEDL